ncbi:MAG TPA: deoxyribonuclease HsdR [Prolixibacteraceae bacterium]|jgi:Do/DeqQ family serine protease|nr:deoxyribonuclease HsdR [Prolixibacteraceae bacterium]
MTTLKKITSVFIIAFVSAALAIFLNNRFGVVPNHQFMISEKTPVHLTKNISNDGQQGQLPDLTEAAEKSVHAVVHIEVKMHQQMDNMPDNPFFKFFFGPDGPQGNTPYKYKQQPQFAIGSGSGVIINPDGYIVTNNHVVDDAVNVDVILNDNRRFTAKVIGRDPNTDIALVKIDATNLPYLNWGKSDGLKLGQWVLAVGNPFNLNSTVTAGIISAKSRAIGIMSGQMPLESFIQTDAAVNPGNSGGALVDAKGDLVGINTAIASQTGSYSGYSFAIPATIAQKVVIDLRKYGEVQRAVLGVVMQSVNDSIAKAKKLEHVEGAYVKSTTDDGAARKAGIKEGDIIVSINGNDIKTGSQLQELIGEFSPGDEVTVGYIRNGDLKDAKVVLRNMKGNTSIVKEPLSVLGAEFAPLTDQDKEKLQIEEGVKVTKLDDGKLKDAGMKPGFIITDINKVAVNSPNDIESVLMHTKSKEPMLIEGKYPDGNYSYYVIKPES